MSDNLLSSARPITSLHRRDEMNLSLLFVCEIDRADEILITSHCGYHLYDNGVFIGSGPARAAHNFFRVDRYQIKDVKHHRFVVEIAGYNCNSYYYAQHAPFLAMEILYQGEIKKYTGENDDFECYLNTSKIQKVSRFSFQRTFSESYSFKEDFYRFLKGKSNPYPREQIEEIKEVSLLKRHADYPDYSSVKFKEIERGKTIINPDLQPYRDRYMKAEHIGIFPFDQWEINPNDTISQLEYRFIKKRSEAIYAHQFKTFVLKSSLTGFIRFEIECLHASDVYFVFDEVSTCDDPSAPKKIEFFRNTTQNIVSYSFKKGTYHHMSFEPYSMKFLRVIVLRGAIKIRNLRLIKYENPLTNAIRYRFKNPKINKIVKAGLSTFAQNAVDILTDCPSRERAGWLCDSYFSGQSEFLITGDNKIETNFLENYGLFQSYPSLPDGMIPMCYPGEYPDGIFIPNWSMFYVLEVFNYFKHHRNESLLLKSQEKIRGLIRYFSAFENEIGLLENLQSWVFIEWSKANDDDFIKGVNIPSNMLYADMLEKASILLNEKNLNEKAEKIRKTIRDIAFNGTFFVDNLIRDDQGKLTLTNHTTETCQYYAFYFNTADKNDYPELFDLLIRRFGPYRNSDLTYPEVYKSNVIMGDYLRLSLLNRYHLSDQALKETVSYFYKMAKLTGTLWEHDSLFASLNHGMTSYVINIIVNAVFGIVDIDPIHKIIFLTREVVHDCASIALPLKDGAVFLENADGKITCRVEGDYAVSYVR